MSNPIDLKKVFPIYKVENDTIISRTGDLTIAFEVALPEIFSLSNEDYEAFHQSWVKAIRVLPKHSCFHKQDWFTKDSFSPIHSDDDSFYLKRVINSLIKEDF